MWTWLKLWLQPPARKIVVRQQSATTLRIAQWRGDQELCNLAGKLLADQNFQLALQVVENDHPAFCVLRDDTPLDIRAMHQARCEGYTLALANLRSLARLEAPVKALEEDYAQSNVY